MSCVSFQFSVNSVLLLWIHFHLCMQNFIGLCFLLYQKQAVFHTWLVLNVYSADKFAVHNALYVDFTWIKIFMICSDFLSTLESPPALYCHNVFSCKYNSLISFHTDITSLFSVCIQDNELDHVAKDAMLKSSRGITLVHSDKFHSLAKSLTSISL